jgi:PST family polysaccharide transporter
VSTLDTSSGDSYDDADVDLRHAAVGGAIWSAAQRWTSKLTQFATFLILARLLHPQQFGLVALASFFIGLTAVFVDLGITSYIVQRESLGARTLETAFWSSLVVGACLTAIAQVVAPFIADLYHQPQLTAVLRVLSLTFVLTALSGAQTAILQRRLRFRSLAIRSLAATLVAAAVAISLAYAGAGVWSLVAQTLTSSGVGAIVLWQVSDWRPSFSFSRSDFREMVVYGMHVAGMQVLGYFRAQGADLIIGSMIGTTALGVFTVANKMLRSVLDMFTSVILVVAGPIFARVKSDRGQLTRAYMHAMSYSVAMTAPVLLVLGINSPTLVPQVFGHQWQESGNLARILCVGAITGALVYFDRTLLLMVNRAKAELGVTAVAMVTHLGVIAATAPFGLHFLVVSLAIRNLLFWPFRLLVARRYAGIDVRAVLVPVVRVLVAAVLAAAVPLAGYLLVHGLSPLLLALASGVVMLPVYGFALFVIARESYAEFTATASQAAARLRRRRPGKHRGPGPAAPQRLESAAAVGRE